jgi:hypothetical protein
LQAGPIGKTKGGKMQKIIIPIITIAAFVITNSCNTPTEKEPIYKDPLTMTWRVDTLEFPGSYQTLLSSIWGSSPNDVYAVGHCEDNDGQFWHYNGVKWEFKNLFQFVEQSSWNLQKVYGFGVNDFWVIGARDRSIAGYEYKESLILQNNGSWIDHKLKFDSYITDLTGTSSRDIWACGTNGVILHYNGNRWKTDTIKIKKLPLNTDYVLAGILKIENETVIVAWTYNPFLQRREQYYIRGTIDNWMIIDSTIFTVNNWGEEERWGDQGLFRTKSGEIFSYGTYGIWSLSTTWIQRLRINYTIRDLYGMSNNYLIAVADFGRILFYNGSEWTELRNLITNQERIHFYSVWTNGEEIFLLGVDNRSTFILHGK